MVKTFKYFQLLSWAFIIMTTVLLLYGNWCGLGLTFDSNNYLAAAASFASSGELKMNDGTPYVVHAPLYPIFISFLGEDPEFYLRIIHLVLYISAMLIIRRIIKMCIGDDLLRLGAFIVIIFSAGILMIYSFIWTEALFLVFFSIHNLYLFKYVNDTKREYLIVMTVAALLMSLTRNAGIFLILPTFVILLLHNTKKLAVPGIYLFSLLGFAIWNIIAFQYPTGVRTILEGVTIFTNTNLNAGNYLGVISSWFLPSIIPFFIRVAVLLFVVIYIFKNLYLKNRLLLFQSVFYILVMIAFIKVDYGDVERLLAVVYPYIIISLFTALDGQKTSSEPHIKRFVVIILAFWIVYVSARGIRNIHRWHNSRCLDYKSLNIER